MSNALAIAAVTSTLVNLLADVDDVVGGTVVTAKPLDKARDNVPGHQLNVFLYQTTIDAAWRNQDLPSARGGEAAVSAPPLALQLHYLLTAIASDDDDVTAHKILGKAMSILHDHAVLDRDDIEAAMAEADVHRQVERVRITPLSLSVEDVSKLWTAFQTQYRVTAAYLASAILIESALSRSPLPVLRRGRTDPEGPVATASPGPSIVAAAPDLGGAERRHSFPVRPGDHVVVTGARLGGEGATVRFRSPRLTAPLDVAAPAGSTDDRIVVPLPASLPAGHAIVSVIVAGPAGEGVTSNAAPVAVAPVITRSPATAPGPDLTVTITATPAPTAEQQPLLLFGARQVPPVSTNGATMTFDVEDVAAATYTLRLRIDGVDSLPLAAPAPGVAPALTAYDPEQQLVVT